jgi:uncharacterized protein (TIGR03437 family)
MSNHYLQLPWKQLALALLLASVVREASAQTPVFATPLPLTAEAAPLAIAVGDFNSDGAQDIAIANAESGTISIYPGAGNGKFSLGPTIVLPSGCQAAYLAAASFTGAKGPDLLTVCPLGPVVVIPNTGHGTFGAPIVTNLPAPAWVGNMLFGYVHPAIADFNGDGHLDIALPTYNQTNKVSAWYLLLGNGNGQFRTPAALPFTGKYGTSMAAGDFNGDGKPDLVTATYTSAVLTLQLALGNGDGTFQTPSTYQLPSASGSALQAIDLNGDGNLDVVITGSAMETSLDHLGDDQGDSAVTVLLGDGKGGFKMSFNAGEPNYMSGGVLAEIFGTGKLDLVESTIQVNVLNDELPTAGLAVRPGNGDGTFGNPIAIALPSNTIPTDLAMADFNGDGRPDIAFPSVPGIQYQVTGKLNRNSDLGTLLTDVLQYFPTGNAEVLLNETPLAVPQIGLTTQKLQFSSTAAATPPAQSVTVSNAGGGTLDWTAASSAAWLSVSPASGSGNAVLSVAASPNGLTAGNYSATISITASGAINSPQSIAVTFTVTVPLPVITGVVNGASFQAGFESGSWVTIQGSNLSNTNPGRTWTANEIVNGSLPESLDGTSVTIDGKPAFVYYISPTQLNVQAPTDSATGPVPVVVTNNGQQSAAFTAQPEPCSPAFFMYNGYVIASHYPDYALIGSASAPAAPGDILILWGTGFGPTNPTIPAGVVVTGAPAATTTPAITIGGVAVPVIGTAMLTAGSAGLYQVAIQLPASMPTGGVSIQASVGGVTSPATALIFVAAQ